MQAGDVIPQVVSPSPSAREGRPQAEATVEMPDVRDRDGEARGRRLHRLPQSQRLPRQSFQHVKHFVSKGAMDIDGLGEKQAMRFLQEGLIADVGDIYDLDEKQLAGMEGFGELSARNLLAAIRGSRGTPFRGCSTRSACPGSAT